MKSPIAEKRTQVYFPDKLHRKVRRRAKADSNIVEFVWLDESLKLKAWDFFRKHDYKDYSFTDCVSFALMKEMKLTRYLGFDKHFERAGFGSFL